MPKVIDASVSSLVDLKAELFRKQEQSKQKGTSVKAPLYVKGSETSSKLFKSDRKKQDLIKEARRDRLEKLEEGVREEEQRLAQARQALEAKAKIYDKLHSGQVRQDDTIDADDRYLVDFEKKQRLEEGEDMVEYTDALGRTRTCHKDELHKYVHADQHLSMPSTSTSNPLEMVSADMKRDMERREWEEEAKAEAAKPVHYQHVLRDEQWDHGVAYYQFSQDEQVRKQQMEELEEMRKNTEEARKRNQLLQAKRKQKLADRLAKVKERKKIRLETGEESQLFAEIDDEETETDLTKLAGIPLPGEVPKQPTAGEINQELNQKLAEARRTTHVREWDRGKATGRLRSYNNWLEDRRKEKDPEFAPPQFNY